jgi:hypothetical protein
MATDGKLRRSFLSDRLELRLLLVAQRSIEALERGAHQIDRSLHGFEPPVHCVKASGWCDRVFRLAFSAGALIFYHRIGTARARCRVRLAGLP